MDTGFPLVSVVMCTYNGELFIEEQLRTLEQQTYPNIEFICSDNGSTDNTAGILKNWCSRKQGRHFFICQEKGLNKNFYSALSHATGGYIIFCDQDDIWLENKVERLVSFHQQHPQNSMVYCLSKEFNGEVPTDTHIRKRNYLEGTDIRKTMLISFTLGHNMCLKKEMLNKMPQSPDEVIAFDWWITVSAMSIGPIKCLPEVLTFWRKHANNTTLFLNSDLFYRSRIGYLKRFCDNPLVKEEYKAWISSMIKHLSSLEKKKFSFGLFWFYLANANTIFFYKTKKNPLGKWVSFIKWSARMSKQSHS
jgi:glycosyltransferase involved in cell wall biosynthesis